jgi:hypothetical protein
MSLSTRPRTLSNHVGMSSPNDSEPPDDPGVLAKLPRTRPQRSSPRRAAARAKSATGAQNAAPRTSAPPAAEQPTGAAPAGTSPNGRAKSAARKPSQSRNGAGSTRQARTSSPAKPPQSGGRARPAAGAASTPAPRQGFESESEHPSRTVNPPGGAELVASLAEVLGEFAKAGLSTGERLLKDAFSRLPLS